MKNTTSEQKQDRPFSYFISKYGLLTIILAAAVYLYVYKVESSYLNYWGLSRDFVYIDLSVLIKDLCIASMSLTVILMVTFIKEKWFLIITVISCIVFFVASLIFYPIFYLFTYSESLLALIGAFLGMFYRLFKYFSGIPIPKTILIILLTYSLLSFFANISGNLYAQDKNNFMVSEKYTGQVVVYKSNETFILMPISSENEHILINKYTLINQEDFGAFTYENRGPFEIQKEN